MARHVCGWLGLLMLQNVMASIVWDFGTDVRGSSVIAQMSGKIHFWDKSVQITFSVPTCMEVNYVHVEVFNYISTPVVTYNKHTHTVLIEYWLLQFSSSYYDIVAKGKRSPECGGDGWRGNRYPNNRVPPGGGVGGENRPPNNRVPPGGSGGGGDRPPNNRVPPGGSGGGGDRSPNNRVPPGGGGGNRPPHNNQLPPGDKGEGDGGIRPPNNNQYPPEGNHQHPSHPGDTENPSSSGSHHAPDNQGGNDALPFHSGDNDSLEVDVNSFEVHP